MTILLALAIVRFCFVLNLSHVTYRSRDFVLSIFCLTWAAGIAVTIFAGLPQTSPIFATLQLILLAIYISRRQTCPK